MSQNGDDPQTIIHELVTETRSDVKDIRTRIENDVLKRLVRVEIGGAVLTAFTMWTMTGKPGAAIPAAILAALTAAKNFFTIF